MKTAIDSSVLFDIVKGAAGATKAQAALEAALAKGSLCVCAIVIAELGRYFETSQSVEGLLKACHIEHSPIEMSTALEAAKIMRQYAKNKGPRLRVAPDFIIGAHALVQADALLTTDDGFYRKYFKDLEVIAP